MSNQVKAEIMSLKEAADYLSMSSGGLHAFSKKNYKKHPKAIYRNPDRKNDSFLFLRSGIDALKEVLRTKTPSKKKSTAEELQEIKEMIRELNADMEKKISMVLKAIENSNIGLMDLAPLSTSVRRNNNQTTRN